MDSLGPECTPLKQRYDACYNKWYVDVFLQGRALNSDDVAKNKNANGDVVPCKEFFDDYKACVTIAIKSSGLDDALEQARREDASDGK